MNSAKIFVQMKFQNDISKKLCFLHSFLIGVETLMHSVISKQMEHRLYEKIFFIHFLLYICDRFFQP